MTSDEQSTLWKLANDARTENGLPELCWGDFRAFCEAFRDAAINFEATIREVVTE